MPTYTPPLRDMQFVMHEVFKVTDEFKAMPQHAEVEVGELAQALRRIGDVRDSRASLREPLLHRTLEDGDEDVVLAAEVQVDRAGGDAGGSGDVRHLRVEVAALGEHVDGGPQDRLAFVHGRRGRLDGAAADAAMQPAGTLALPFSSGQQPSGLYLDTERAQLAVLAEGNTGGIYDNWFAPQWWGQGQTGLALVNTPASGAMTLRRTALRIGSSAPSKPSGGCSASRASTASGVSTGAAKTGPTPGSISTGTPASFSGKAVSV